jgi:cytochrome P450
MAGGCPPVRKAIIMQSNPPGPKAKFFIGHMNEFQNEKLSFFQSLHQYGDISRFWFGPFPAYYIASPDYIHQVLVTDADKMNKSRALKTSFRLAIGNGIFLNDGDSWKRQRKLVQPAFHTKRIGAYADTMVEYTQRMMNDWRDGDTLEINEEMSGLTMKIISKTLFDADLPHDVEAISDAITAILQVVGIRLQSIMFAPDWLPTPNNRRLKQGIEKLDRIIQRFVDDRRKSGEDKGDLLSMLLSAQDEDGTGMDDKQVRDEAMTLFGAGHETTAVALTWTLYLLSQYPDAEAKLREEVDSVLGERPATLADLPNMPYGEMLVKESMRLYPPAWGTSRDVIEDVEIGGYPVKKGSPVVMSFHAMHRDPRYWDEPERFNPERFNPENEKRIPKYVYLPFGAGPRVCIGNTFAMMEARLILATIAQRFTLTLVPGHQVVPDPIFTLRPRHGMLMTAHRRNRIATQTSPHETLLSR